jgi:hypothetical protein
MMHDSASCPIMRPYQVGFGITTISSATASANSAGGISRKR